MIPLWREIAREVDEKLPLKRAERRRFIEKKLVYRFLIAIIQPESDVFISLDMSQLTHACPFQFLNQFRQNFSPSFPAIS